MKELEGKLHESKETIKSLEADMKCKHLVITRYGV